MGLKEVVDRFDNAISKMVFMSTAMQAIHQDNSAYVNLTEEERLGFEQLSSHVINELKEVRDCVDENFGYLRLAKRASESLEATTGPESC